MKITVFTPAYNRGYIISKLYQSLKRQTYADFEWIVIDDGSTDNTGELFQKILSSQNFFPVTYKKVENGGKHRAINIGVKMAKGELFFIVDSDDYLTDDSLEEIVRVESTIPFAEKSYFAGVCGQRGGENGVALGTTYAGNDFLDITTLERPKYAIAGDKAEVWYTELLKKYPFPEFKGEKFVTECVVWDKIAYDGYKLRFFNKQIYICDYLEDGLTKNYNKVYEENPQSYGLYIYQSIKYGKIDKYAVMKYLNIHRKRYSYWRLAKYLHMSFGDMLPYMLERADIKHLPNRVAMKLVGEKLYKKIKNILKDKI